MARINLRYGKAEIPFQFDEEQFEVLGNSRENKFLTDVEIGEKFDRPIASPPLEEIINSGESVLIVVPDATRQTACGQIVNLLVRRLIANGTMPFEIKIIFATGIHRKVSDEEKREILTPFIVQRIVTLDHNAKDLMSLAGLDSKQFVTFGEINNAPIELNKILTEFDHIITVGGVSFHYFAGFTGGRKLICPGLASEKTISATHKLAFDCETKSRRKNVGTGILQGNAVHEAFVEVARNVKPSFSFNTIVNENGEVSEVFCGDWIRSHEAACAFYAAKNTLQISEKREIVAVSCGGFPHDVNLIQAHKALDSAAQACTDGGQIILLAECADGLGRSDFLKWFEAETSEKLAENLCENYQVNGQTAWSLLQKTEKFDVRVITSLPEYETRRMHMIPARSLDEIEFDKNKKGYILPFGAKNYLKVKERK